MTLLASLLMRRASAARRHLLWSATLTATLLIPALSMLLPQWQVLPGWFAAASPARPASLPQYGLSETQTAKLPPAAVEWLGRNAEQREVARGTAPASQQVTASVRTVTIGSPQWRWMTWTWRDWVCVGWLAGLVACLVPIAIGTVAVWRMQRRSTPAGSFASQFAEAGIRVVLSERCHMPMVAGIFRPAIILPADAGAWEPARLRSVIAHEKAHLRRCDCLWQLVGRIARAVYWFNPLAWMALERLLAESERACDDAVLDHGSRPSDYAEHLLAVASGGRSDALLAAAAIAMAGPNRLEGRLLAILDQKRSRSGVTIAAIVLAGILLGGAVVPLAMLRAANDVPTSQETKPSQTQPYAAQGGTTIKVVTDTVKMRVIFGSGDTILVDGKPARWDDLPKLAKSIRDPQTVTLEMAAISDTMPLYEFRQAQSRLFQLVNQCHLKTLSDTGTASPEEIVAIAKAAATPTTIPAENGIVLTLKANRSLKGVPVYALADRAQPVICWQVQPNAGPVDYLAIIVVPSERPDVENIATPKLWQMMNIPDKWAWGVMGIPGMVTWATYAQHWPGNHDILELHAAEALKKGYYLLWVMGYQGQFRQEGGREPVVVGSAVLEVGNPIPPPKEDLSKLTPEQMRARLQGYVEGFFQGNFRDITARKTIEWGQATKDASGNWSIRYRYEATIWNKDKIVQDKVFTFTPEGGFVSVNDARPAVPATRPGATNLPPLEQRKLDRTVSQFPEQRDLSSPETAWAAWQRACAKMDAQAVADLSWVQIPLDEQKAFWQREMSRDPEGTKLYAQATANAKLLEVWVDRGEVAVAICYLPFPDGKGQSPYSIRTFGKISGQWKNLGEARLGTLDKARAFVESNRSTRWDHAQRAMADSPATKPAGGPASDLNLPPLRKQEVNKTVSQLPDKLDVSTPETAWAAWERAWSRKDAQAVCDLTWVKLDPKELDEMWSKRRDLDTGVRAAAEATLIETWIDRDQHASVISFVPDTARKYYSIRCFGKIGSEWKNLGEDAASTLEDARHTVELKRSGYWVGFLERQAAVIAARSSEKGAPQE